MDPSGKRFPREREQKLGPTDWRWYITRDAIRQYMELTGLHDDEALKVLGGYSLTARPVPGKNTESGALIYRTGTVQVGTRRMRLEFTVMPIPRKEGALPQLIRVTGKSR
jgi:hypothetical protein